MTEYYIPTRASETEFTEKRSRFIGHVWRVESEAEARARIEEMKKRHYDARHNCWCYLLQEGGVVRYSDDGEPQGTAGQPMLNVFQREERHQRSVRGDPLFRRYPAGGRGTGPRLYAERQGRSGCRRHLGGPPVDSVTLTVPYSLFERVKLEAESLGGVLGEPEYAAEVTMPVLLPEEKVKSFTQRITEITAGGVVPAVTGERLKDVPR